MDQELSDHGRHASEKMWADGIFEPGGGRSLWHDQRGEAGRIHRWHCRRPDQFDFEFRQGGNIGVKGARIGVEVFARGELGRINEYRDDHPIGTASRPAYERKMPFVQRAHGRHQCDFTAAGAEIRHGAAQRGYGADDARKMLGSSRSFHDDVAA